MYPALSLPPAALAPVLDALAPRTAAFGVNFIVPLIDQGSLELAVARAPYVDFFLADPDPALVAAVHDGGAACGWQVETVDEARAAEAAGCDVVIAKAWESGGRKRREGPALIPLLDGVLGAVALPGDRRRRDRDSARSRGGARRRRRGGARGHVLHRRGRVRRPSRLGRRGDRRRSRGRGGDDRVQRRPARSRPAPGAAELDRGRRGLAEGQAGLVRLAGAEITVERFSPLPPTRGSTGAIEAMPFYAGQSAGAVQGVRPAAEIVAELAGRYDPRGAASMPRRAGAAR